jgi:hypothetical protein
VCERGRERDGESSHFVLALQSLLTEFLAFKNNKRQARKKDSNSERKKEQKIPEKERNKQRNRQRKK